MGATLVIVVFLCGETDELDRGFIRLSLIDILMAEVYLAIKGEVTAGSVVDLCALRCFALLLSEGTLLVNLVAVGELRPDMIWAGDIAGSQPWVTDDVSNAEALVWVELHHASE